MTLICSHCSIAVDNQVDILKCLDKYWHKNCFKCSLCSKVLNINNCQGYNRMPYCQGHCPEDSFTNVVDTPVKSRLRNLHIKASEYKSGVDTLSDVEFHSDNETKFNNNRKMLPGKDKTSNLFLTAKDTATLVRTYSERKMIRPVTFSNVSKENGSELSAKLTLRRIKNEEVDDVDLGNDKPTTYDIPKIRVSPLIRRETHCGARVTTADSELTNLLDARRTKNGETILKLNQENEKKEISKLPPSPLAGKKIFDSKIVDLKQDTPNIRVMKLTQSPYMRNDILKVIAKQCDDNALAFRKCPTEYEKKVELFKMRIFPLFEASNLFESVYTFPILSADEFIQSSTKSLRILDFYDNITFFNYKRGFNNLSLQKLWDVILKKEDYTKSDIRMLMVELNLPIRDKVDFLRIFTKDPRLSSYLSLPADERKVGIEDIRKMCMEEIITDDVVHLLKVECPLCGEDSPIHSIQNFLTCEHAICKDCFKRSLEENIMNKSPEQWNCPMCGDNVKLNKQLHYCNLKEFMISNGCSENISHVFNDKLLDGVLMNSKNFVRCANDQCVYGFEVEGDIKKMKCPICLTNMCVQCNQKWEDVHDNMTCQEYNLWMVNSGARSSEILNCIECPNCKKIFDLIRGGCIHMICSKCKYEFCRGCFNEFTSKCQEKKCQSAGLHAHHPRNCFYFLRDRTPNELENMLKGTNYPVLQNKPEKQCIELTSSEKDKKEKLCSTEVYSSTGLCLSHYNEYLIRGIIQLRVDPAKFSDTQQLNCMLIQVCQDTLTKYNGESDEKFLLRLRKEVVDKCALFIPKEL